LRDQIFYTKLHFFDQAYQSQVCICVVQCKFEFLHCGSS